MSIPGANLIQSSILKTYVRSSKFRPSPTVFNYPGLNYTPIYNPQNFKQFDLISDILMGYKKEILNDFNNIHESGKLKNDYNTSKSSNNEKDEHRLHEGKWEWNSYLIKGKIQEEFVKQCPNTVAALNSIPLLMSGTPFSFSFFSVLNGNSSIGKHFGPCNLRIRGHFPIIIPQGDLGIEIAGETHKWEEGKLLIFDDCYEHRGNFV